MYRLRDLFIHIYLLPYTYIDVDTDLCTYMYLYTCIQVHVYTTSKLNSFADFHATPKNVCVLRRFKLPVSVSVSLLSLPLFP